MIPDRLDTHETPQFLRSDQLAAISDVAHVVDCQAGDAIYGKGAKAEHFFVVLEGQVSLRLPKCFQLIHAQLFKPEGSGRTTDGLERSIRNHASVRPGLLRTRDTTSDYESFVHNDRMSRTARFRGRPLVTDD